MPLGFRIRHLSFLGPQRQPATVTFGPGMNVIYGASDTGKSFVVDCIDFMLGGKTDLRDLPEREGYDRVLLGIENYLAETFTLHRSISGGAFTLYEGLYSEALPTVAGRVLADQHNEARDDNLSKFLLQQIGLVGQRIRRNKSGDTNSLSFRNIARLAIVNEEEIIQQRSPLSDGNNYIADTPNTATFKLLLTGVDDSSLSSSKPTSPAEHSRSGQIELLSDLISQQEARVRETAGRSDELEEQATRLDATIESQAQQLAITESQFRESATRRRTLRQRWQEADQRLVEINVLLERFTLLQTHYLSDLQRLQAIQEAGTLFAALRDANCPVCGAKPEHQHKTAECEGDSQRVVQAAAAEIAKIEALQNDLIQTIKQLGREERSLAQRTPKLHGEIAEISNFLEVQVSPNLRAIRHDYAQLANKRSEVREALALAQNLKELQDRKSLLEAEIVSDASSSSAGTELSTASTDRFAALVLEVLKEWHFPGVQRVHFDHQTRDLVIDGKKRTSFGKGLRAITQAAFSISLMQYCRRYETAHPGFVVLDSPLLSYKEPEGQDDDLRGTDLKQRFYEFLQKLPDNQQVIIIENTDPPADVQDHSLSQKFTRTEGVGRFGLFPKPNSNETIV